jgi:aspartate-semialdehyde dehydrogenase
MSRDLSVAVVGATGAVGQTILSVLAERDFPAADMHALASERSAGQYVELGSQQLRVADVASFDFAQVDVALFSAGGTVSAEQAPRAAEAGCWVVDNSSYFRLNPQVPLVVPEVNPEALSGLEAGGIIANPNCSTIQMVAALKPLADAAGLAHVNVATYQAVSGSGNEGVEELAGQTRGLFNQQPVEPSVYPRTIAFNCLPHIDAFQDNGYTGEEMKMIRETQKILGRPDLGVNATTVRVPVFYGHSEAVTVETERPLSADEARRVLAAGPGVEVMDDPAAEVYPTAFETAGTDPVYVGRIRADLSRSNSLNLWVVADNIRKGAALNAVQIAEHLPRGQLS